MRIKGQIGPVIGGKDYRRLREITTQLSGEAMTRVISACMHGDDATAPGGIGECAGQEYHGGFRLDDSLDLDFLR